MVDDDVRTTGEMVQASLGRMRAEVEARREARAAGVTAGAMATLCHGGQFKRVVVVRRPAEVDDDAKADAFVSGLLAMAGPLPPGLEPGAPILGRAGDGLAQPVVRVSLYGPSYAVGGASTDALYAAWAARLAAMAEAAWKRQAQEGRGAEGGPRA